MPLNDTNPLWLKSPKDCTDEEYIKFYQQVFNVFDEPLIWIHLNVDYPFNLKGILYFPKLKNEFELVEGKVKLYNNQVFVADNIKEVIPEFLLLLKGVIDCPDLPLNVSRSFLQNDRDVSKISKHIVKKVADKLKSLCKNEREKYESFWDDIQVFIKYGCLKDEGFYDKIKEYILYKDLDGKYITLKDYLEYAKDKHENKVFYVVDKEQQSQYIKLFKEYDLNAVILDCTIDNNFITFLEYKESGVRFKRIDSDLSDVLKDKDEEKDEEKENSLPIINASDKTIELGSKFNPLDGVSASDEEDGDLTSKIKVVENKVDVNSIGKYSVSFEITDSGGKSITKSINVTVEAKSESKSNKSPIIYAEDITVALGSKYDPYAMVSASDPEDGNITNKIKVVYNYVNVNKEGTYKVGYKVTDSSGNSASCVIKVKVKDMNTQKKKEKTNNVPVIYCNDIFIALNSKFNPLGWVAVTDKEDGDITNKVMAIYNNVNTSIEGNYHVTYEVVDSDGNKVNKAMMVVVQSEDELNKENTPPIINANNITVKKGTYFNPLDGVTALDREDGNLTNNIIIKEDSVNINKSGVYQITYEVTDKKGLSATKTINVTIEGTGIFNSLVIVEISIVVLLIIGISSITVAIISNRKKK